ncbi:hypothetical protein SUGI_0648780 [Cryptomeria japonica]|nr:hypothetical protein SUGI_0648780 [Cryptomeria japonica]
MIFSTSVFDAHNPESAGFKNSFGEMAKLGGTPNLADFFPFLRFLDPQGVSGETAKHLKDFTLVDIRALITDLFVAGTETITTTIEWVMAEFIRNPQKLNRVRQELGEVVGCNRKVEESDLEHLPYLQAAVKEIFQLHPTVPLLLPNKAESSCVIGGYLIPKDSQVMVNVWAIGMDPAICKRPSEFLHGDMADDLHQIPLLFYCSRLLHPIIARLGIISVDCE